MSNDLYYAMNQLAKYEEEIRNLRGSIESLEGIVKTYIKMNYENNIFITRLKKKIRAVEKENKKMMKEMESWDKAADAFKEEK